MCTYCMHKKNKNNPTYTILLAEDQYLYLTRMRFISNLHPTEEYYMGKSLSHPDRPIGLNAGLLAVCVF